MYIFAQILGGVAIAVILAYSILPVGRKIILLGNILVNLLWAVHFAILGAYSGALCSLLCSIMALVFYFKGRGKILSSIFVPVAFGALFLAFGIITWDNYYSLIPAAVNIMLVVALWLNREILIKILYIPMAALWVFYNAIYFSWIGIIGQSLSFCFNTAFVIYWCIRRKSDEERGTYKEKTQS